MGDMIDKNAAKLDHTPQKRTTETGSKITQPLGAFGRRRALAVLGGMATGGLAMSGVALAQDAPILPTPPPTPASPAPLLTPRPVPTTNVIPSSSLGPISRDKTYFIFFQVNVDLQTTKTLRSHLVSLVEAGVSDITIVIGSGGGLLVPALQLYNLIRSLPARIATHGQIFVASAANILYLAGEERSADSNVNFLFHPTQTTINGSFSTPQFADQMEMMNVSNEFVESIYHDRTKIPDTEIKKFRQETVIYDTSKALEFGIVQTIGGLKVPAGGKAKFVFVE